jgi:hypothetical protein
MFPSVQQVAKTLAAFRGSVDRPGIVVRLLMNKGGDWFVHFGESPVVNPDNWPFEGQDVLETNVGDTEIAVSLIDKVKKTYSERGTTISRSIDVDHANAAEIIAEAERANVFCHRMYVTPNAVRFSLRGSSPTVRALVAKYKKEAQKS